MFLLPPLMTRTGTTHFDVTNQAVKHFRTSRRTPDGTIVIPAIVVHFICGNNEANMGVAQMFIAKAQGIINDLSDDRLPIRLSDDRLPIRLSMIGCPFV